jgi:hypothetical protein
MCCGVSHVQKASSKAVTKQIVHYTIIAAISKSIQAGLCVKERLTVQDCNTLLHPQKKSKMFAFLSQLIACYYHTWKTRQKYSFWKTATFRHFSAISCFN